MSATSPPNPPAVQPAKRSTLAGAFWPIAIFIAVMLYIQWPAVTDLYYRLSGTEPPKSKIAWRDNFQSAQGEVRSGDKPMLLVFSATWCGPCNEMKRNVWSNPQVGDAVEAGFVPVHIDIDDAQHAEVADRYAVRSIPAVFVLDADGQVLARQSYMSRAETLAFLDANGKP